MKNKNFYVGMSMGIMAAGAVAAVVRPKKRRMKSAMGKALKTMGEVADSISDSMGW